MSKAMEELVSLTGGYREEKEARESAILNLSGLMTSAPVKRDNVRSTRRTTEPDTEEEKELAIVKAAVELYERDPQRFKELVLHVKGGEPSEMMQMAGGKDREAGVMTLAGMVQGQLEQGGS